MPRSSRPLSALPVTGCLAAFGLSIFSGEASAAIALINAGFDAGVSDWSGSGHWWWIQAGGDGLLSLEADDLAPHYSAAGGSVPTQAKARTVVSGLVAGQTYELSFDAGFVAGYYESANTDPLLTLSPGEIQVFADSAPVGAAISVVSIQLTDPQSSSPAVFGGLGGSLQRVTVTFTAQAETATLGWLALESAPTGPESPDIPNALLLLDNVSLTPLPEPSAAFLVMLAAAVMRGGRRRSSPTVITSGTIA